MAKERGGVIDQAAAEALLRRYLDERGWRYEWEQREFGGKRPDAVILSESGEPIAVIDATIVIEQADIKAATIAERKGIMAVPTELTHSELPEVLLRTISRKAQQASPVAEAGLPYLLAAHIRMPPLERIARGLLTNSSPLLSARLGSCVNWTPQKSTNDFRKPTRATPTR